MCQQDLNWPDAVHGKNFCNCQTMQHAVVVLDYKCKLHCLSIPLQGCQKRMHLFLPVEVLGNVTPEACRVLNGLFVHCIILFLGAQCRMVVVLDNRLSAPLHFLHCLYTRLRSYMVHRRDESNDSRWSWSAKGCCNSSRRTSVCCARQI